ncbi:MAG: PD-(D/E)XK nuclease family protein [Desulfobacteraceae bacterium]|nr:PD-(D/E)XK nuclease family protein [Desulfobacteraceae bacterium]
MTRGQKLQLLTEELYISYSQIFTYVACSLKYKFQYVENRPYERISINLPFGGGIHTTLERYYRSLKEKNERESLNILEELFEDCISLELDHTDIPLIYKKEAPDRKSVVQLGKSMLKAFYEGIDLSSLEVVDVEVPLSARLYTDESEATDFMLIGIIDLLLMDKNHELIVVDNKTAAKAKKQSDVDDDLQFSAYSYLVASNRFTFPTASIKCRMDVLRKLKKPKLEHYHTTRNAEQRKRFAKIANAVLSGIESRIFIPNKSWLCSDCQYISACEAW